MLIQAYDFWHLWKTDRCELQMGGTRPVGQHHRRHRAHLAQGGRRARTGSSSRSSPPPPAPSSARPRRARSGSIPQKTSPYKFFQFWLNTDDRDVERLLKFFTFPPWRRSRRCMAEHGARPGQAAGAAEAGRGDDGARPRRGDRRRAVVEASRLLFGGTDLRGAGAEVLRGARGRDPVRAHLPRGSSTGSRSSTRSCASGSPPRRATRAAASRARASSLNGETVAGAGADARPRRTCSHGALRDAAEGEAEPRPARRGRRGDSAPEVTRPLRYSSGSFSCTRTMDRARPVASSMSTIAPCSQTSRFAGSNGTGRCGEEALEHELLPHADDRVPRAAHAHVGDERGAAREHPRVGGLDVRVRPEHRRDLAVEEPAHRVLLARRLAVHVDEDRGARPPPSARPPPASATRNGSSSVCMKTRPSRFTTPSRRPSGVVDDGAAAAGGAGAGSWRGGSAVRPARRGTARSRASTRCGCRS